MTCHERSYRTTCICSGCDGTGLIEIASTSAQSSEMAFANCKDCGGTGEVEVRPLERVNGDEGGQ